MKHIASSLLFLASALAGLSANETPSPVQKLAWAPPELEDPIVIQLGHEHRSLKLDRSKDYRIELPRDAPWVGELNIYGGRNVVVIGGEIHIPDGAEDPAYADDVPKDRQKSHRALYLKGQTGTIHVEGVLFSGGGLKEGINLDERAPGCVVQLQNIRCETLHGSYKGHHADVLQTWAGPAVLRIDRLTGLSEYQGFFLLPNQHFALDKDGFRPTRWEFRHINLLGTPASAYLLWCPEHHGFPIDIEDVWVRPAPRVAGNRDMFLWPKPHAAKDDTWNAVHEGEPPDGDFVPAGVAGLGYASPGYAER